MFFERNTNLNCDISYIRENYVYHVSKNISLALMPFRDFFIRYSEYERKRLNTHLCIQIRVIDNDFTLL